VNAAGDLALLARVSASLIVVVVIAVLAARLARRAGRPGPGVGLRVIDRTGLTRDAAVAVVEVAGRGLVVGVSPHGVTVLAELDPEQLAATTATAAHAGDRWAELLPGTVEDRGGAAEHLGAGRRAGTGALLDPRTWRQGIEALRDLTARRG
jgi:flagellar protein FliO/FliZ